MEPELNQPSEATLKKRQRDARFYEKHAARINEKRRCKRECPTCHKQINSQYLSKHMRLHEQSYQPPLDIEPPAHKLRCPVCSMFISRFYLPTHIAKRHEPVALL